jgi:pSer/pThr/pTyr-binding forkhead associated (FHA) protein
MYENWAKQKTGGMKMYIEFLEGSPLWYWYNYGGVIAGMAVTVIVAAMLIGLSSWKAEGIFVKTLGVASLVTVMPLGLARLGFRMAISNPELVGYLSIGGTAVILVTGLIFFASRSAKKSNKVQVAAPAVNKKEAREAVRSEKKEVPNLKTDNELTIHMKDDKKVSVNSETVTIGRSPDNTIVIDDPSVSRKHARITRKGDGYYLEDLNSTNGVTIDGVSVDGKEIEQGAVVKLGKIEIGVGSPMIDTKLHEENREKESNISDPMENTYMGTPKPNRVGWLTVNGGKNAGDVFYLNPGDNTLGRNNENQIVIDDSYVSGIHCELKIEDDEVTLFDLGSRSGTKVNEKVLTGRPVNPGSSINVGDTEFKVLRVDSPDQFNSVVDMEQTAVDIRGEQTVVLVAITGPDAGKSFTLVEGINMIGRNPGSRVSLSDGTVSRKHAMIKCSDGKLTLFDMGSTAGTKLNGAKLGGVEVESGDVISVGRTEMTFIAAAA